MAAADLELHLVRVLLVGETELGLQVAGESGFLRARLDGGEQLLVHVELRLLSILGDLVFLFLLLEDLGLVGLGRLLGLDAREELVVEVLRDVDLADVDLGRCGDHVDLVDAAERAAVELERAGHEEETRLELLQEHDAFSGMSASDQDEHGSGRDGRPELVFVLRERLLVSPQLPRLLLSRVELGESVGADQTRAAVLVALDGLLDHARGRLLLVARLLLVRLLPLLDEPEAALVEHATARETHDAARLELLVDGRLGSLGRLRSRLRRSRWCHF